MQVIGATFIWTVIYTYDTVVVTMISLITYGMHTYRLVSRVFTLILCGRRTLSHSHTRAKSTP